MEKMAEISKNSEEINKIKAKESAYQPFDYINEIINLAKA